MNNEPPINIICQNSNLRLWLGKLGILGKTGKTRLVKVGQASRVSANARSIEPAQRLWDGSSRVLDRMSRGLVGTRGIYREIGETRPVRAQEVGRSLT